MVEVSLSISVSNWSRSASNPGFSVFTSSSIIHKLSSESGQLSNGPVVAIFVWIWAVVDWSSSLDDLSQVSIVPGSLEDEDDDHDVEDTKTDEDESKYLTTSVSSDETSVDGFAAAEGNSGVGENSDSHTNVSSHDGSKTSSGETDSSVWEVGWGNSSSHLEEIDSASKEDGKGSGPDEKIDIFFVEESFSTVSDFLSALEHSIHNLGSGSWVLSTSGSSDSSAVGVLDNASSDMSPVISVRDFGFQFISGDVGLTIFWLVGIDNVGIVESAIIGFVTLHLDALDQESTNKTPTNSEDGAAEDDNWNNTKLEVLIWACLLNI